MVLTPAILPAQTIIAPSGRTLFRGASLVRTTFEIDRSSFSSGGESVSVTKYVPVIAGVYGFRPKWSLIVAQPYAGVEMVRRISGMTERQGFSGLGDTRLFVQYDGLYSRNTPGGLTRLSGVFGLQVPAGSSRLTTGAVEYSAGLIFEKAVKLNYVFSADAEYTFATANARGISTGDRFRFDGAVARMVIPKQESSSSSDRSQRIFNRVFRYGTYFILELNGQWQREGALHGVSMPNTGGTTVSLSPGVQYFVNNSLLAEFAVPIPVLRNLNGVRPKPDTSFVMGFRYLF
jgi:hypothetical protein